MTQSSELAGGAGFTFGDAVSATYLASLLQQGFAPGIQGRTVCRVALEQRDLGEPLDDPKTLPF
jgi:N-acetylglucosamine kinase-like BadF-type ATPase